MPVMRLMQVLVAWGLGLLLLGLPVRAAEVRVAVAANFTDPARAIATAFERTSGHAALLSFGSTGQFFAQITQGAPFDVLLAADVATPARAVAAGHAVPGTTFTYAAGRLALYSTVLPGPLGDATLRAGAFQKLAIANPATAPYGAAAIETLKALGLFEAVSPKLVQGKSVAQALQFTDGGNAEVGFVALSQVAAGARGAYWLVPQVLHAPILQDAVLLARGKDNPAARAFLDFLRSDDARRIVERFGYGQGD